MAVKSESFKSIREIKTDGNLEIVIIDILTDSNSHLIVCSCYRPPNSNEAWLTEFNNFLADICNNYDNVILAGDFNFRNIDWQSDIDVPTKGTSCEFLEILKDYFLTQVNSDPTRGNNVLDLIITSLPDKVNVREIISPETSGIVTDHDVISFEIDINPARPPKTMRMIYDYKNANFDGLRAAIDSSNLCDVISEMDDINDAWILWKNTFLRTVAEFVPMRKIKNGRNIPWLTGEIRHLLKIKETVRRKLGRSPSIYLQEKFKNLRAQVKHLLKNSRKRYFDSLEKTLYSNPKRFWKLFKLNSKSRNIPQSVSWTTENDQKVANSTKSIAELFNGYFASVFTDHLHNHEMTDTDPADFNEAPPQNLDELNISELEVVAALRGLNPDKALGPDGIPGRILKETAQQIAPTLTLLFNKSLHSAVLPDEWKLANVVPVFKKGVKEHVQNYRPISLLCIVSKVLERCVLNHIWEHLQNVINDCQHGFMPGRSCTSQLVGVLDKIGKLLDRGEQVDVIYLDMTKAFDRVNHEILINKLRRFGFNNNLLNWFQSYLHHRRQQVTVLGSTSSSLPVTSGVPQWSILGPILFLLYT